MLIHALVTAVWTLPEPTIFAILDRIDEVLADFIGRCLWIAVLRFDDISQFLFIPVVHRIFLLLAFAILTIPVVSVEILFLRFPLNRKVV